MVLADRGVCCVDEFDKMTDADRVAIHEVMEQQTVTIAKAGIHASLNARCAVVAAANPVYGQYDPNQPPMKNIGLPDSLLSRFDLLFIILDKKQEDSDRRISEHVLRMHCSRRTLPSCIASGIIERSTDERTLEAKTAAINSKTDLAARAEDDSDLELIAAEFIKKYIHYAKVKYTPQLTEAASDHITEAYANLRARVAVSAGRTLPVTARTLETMIRLASAHAKCHLRGEVGLEDATVAVELLEYALLSETSSDACKAAACNSDEICELADKHRGIRVAGETDIRNSGHGAYGTEAINEEPEAPPGAAAEIVETSRRKVIEDAMQTVFVGEREDCSIDELLKVVPSRVRMTAAEAATILDELQADDKVMYVDGRVHLI